MAADLPHPSRLSTHHLCFLTLLTIIELLCLRLPRVSAISSTGQINFSKAEAEELAEDMLSVLDLDPELTYSKHRRKRKYDDSSAPMFMKDVYKELDEMNNVISNDHRHNSASSFSWRNSHLRRQYNVSSWIEDSFISADFIVSVPQDEDFKPTSADSQRRLLLFKFDHLEPHRHLSVIGSELRIFRYGYAYAGEHMRLVLERMRPNGKSVPVVAETITKDLIPGQTGWIEVNVTSFVRRWMDQPYDNAGIYIRLLNARGLDLPPDLLGFETGPEHSFSPFVVASFETGPQIVPRRRKRSIKRQRTKRRHRRYQRRYESGKNKGVCHRRSFRVDFEKLQWDRWIIAPAFYNAYICQGGCPIQLMTKLKITNHSIVQTMLRYKNLGIHGRKQIPPTCCVPTDLKPLKLLYYKDTRVILRSYDNMVVRTCGCH